MQLVFLYGPPASGKLTIGRLVAERTGLPLFHNHLVVDAVAAIFPFGSDAFIRLREQFWLDIIAAAAAEGRSLIFTFAPEPTVARDFPERLMALVAAVGGSTVTIALDLSDEEQERRLGNADRGHFGKLRSPELLRELQPALRAATRMMPEPMLRINTVATDPAAAADAIIGLISV